MHRPRVHPVLLIGLLSLAATTVVERLICPSLPPGFLLGFLDGLGLACLFGYLLALRMGRLRQS
jgi:hypothetical protein